LQLTWILHNDRCCDEKTVNELLHECGTGPCVRNSLEWVKDVREVIVRCTSPEAKMTTPIQDSSEPSIVTCERVPRESHHVTVITLTWTCSCDKKKTFTNHLKGSSLLHSHLDHFTGHVSVRDENDVPRFTTLMCTRSELITKIYITALTVMILHTCWFYYHLRICVFLMMWDGPDNHSSFSTFLFLPPPNWFLQNNNRHSSHTYFVWQPIPSPVYLCKEQAPPNHTNFRIYPCNWFSPSQSLRYLIQIHNGT
jgi:hypothetical protein